jgi:transketolase
MAAPTSTKPKVAGAKASSGHGEMANAIRFLAMDAVQKAKSGHPGMPMGMADVATVLFTQVLKYDPAQPAWPDRDRFVLSAGHGSMLLYALLYLTGYPGMTLDEIKNFRQLDSKTPGHPEYGEIPGVETTTGPLGQGLANAVGMALAERLMNARYGDGLVDHRTFAIAGDGCLMEGISHEAASLAGHLRLGKLIVLFDDNHISIDGPTSLSVSDDALRRFESYGWAAEAIDGHDPAAIATALERAKAEERPSLIACRTTIGYGAPKLAGTEKTHGAPLGEEEIAGARAKLGWPHAAFEIPDAILQSWRQAGARGATARGAWDKRLAGIDAAARKEFERRIDGALPDNWRAKLNDFKQGAIAQKPSMATRVASQKSLEALNPSIPELIGGSADLTGSNNTKTGTLTPVGPGAFDGRYIYYGVREHAMVAAMNGLALHGGLIPYGGTFLVFSDYCRPSIRLAALMRQRVVYVFTHDSIGLGEDGPTHQPVEHLAALRAIPNLNVFRPGDAVETAECWELALESRETPSVLALTRQNLPTVRVDCSENYSAFGAYILAPASRTREVTLIATGSEVEIALAAQQKLEEIGIAASVVSMPCWELFLAQPPHYREEVLGHDTLRVAIEAGVQLGWERWIGPDGAFIGMSGFGASAPYKDLYNHFGITAEAVVEAVKARL